MEISKFRLQVSKVLRSERTRAPEDFAAVLRRTAVFLKRLPGHFSGRFIRPLIGFGFDLSGGIYRVDGCQFEIPVHLTDRNYRSAFVLGEYEAGERRLIRRFLRADDQVIEVGGCIGVLSCLVNSRLTFPTRHLVVEANPEVIPWLQRHRQLNRAGFKIEHCAVTTQSEVEFAIHRFMTHGSISAQGGASVVQVPGRSLADLHKSFGPFNVLLMDVEGHELKILAASQDLLRDYRLVIVELHPETLGANGIERCEDILRSSGLQRAARIHFSEAWVRSSPAPS
jgi:FkbM family methyltransferase